MKTLPHPRMALAGALLALLAAAACTRVVETKGIEQMALAYAPTCHSTLGAYYLPRALLKLSVKADPAITTTGLDTGMTMIADRAQPFCLDFLALPTSDDIVSAQRDANGLLKAVTSDVTDKTPEIVQKLLATGEDLAIQNGRSAVEAEKGDALDLEFDPFVPRELELANKALNRFGYCLFVENYSFAVGEHASARQVASQAERWCEKPWTHSPPGRDLATLPVPPEVMQMGVLYRPNAAHKIVIMRKKDPGRRGAQHWALYQTRRVEVPNVSPVLVIGVERAMFANRTTTLKFNSGVLTDVTVDKKSELAGFVGIPLGVAKAIVDVPGQIVKVRLADTNNELALLNAQSQLIDTIAKYNAEVPADQRSAAGGTSRSALVRNADYRTGLMIGGCKDAGGGDACNSLLNGRR